MNDDQTDTHSGDAPGSSLTPTHGVWLVVGTALGALVVLGVIFRRGPVRD